MDKGGLRQLKAFYVWIFKAMLWPVALISAGMFLSGFVALVQKINSTFGTGWAVGFVFLNIFLIINYFVYSTGKDYT